MSGNDFKIAIIGMAGVFPDSDSIAELWKSLLEKKVLVRKFEMAELNSEAHEQAKIHGEHYLPFRGFLNHAECFDHDFFKISYTDALETDPQQRILLQVAYNALRDSGLSPELLKSRNVGVYASCSPCTYEQILKQSRPAGDIMSVTGCLRDLVASRISYTLNLHGPAVNVQTGCSSSLSAVYEATKALLSNECNVALVGASSIRFPQNSGHVFQEGGIYSKDGLCRPFDEESSGTVSGNGCAAIILKRYEDAVADGDRIYCAINTILANNDGNRKASIAAPSVDGQSDLISEVFKISGVNLDELAFIETHGTATALGDAVEYAALTRSFSAAKSGTKCAIGSIKANIGHLDSTSGLAGLIKAALSLYAGTYPAQPLYVRPNSSLNIEKGPFFVNTENLTLPKNKKYAAVNSLGIGGTNVFALLEKVHSFASTQPDQEKFIPIRVNGAEQINSWVKSVHSFLTLNPEAFQSLNTDIGSEKGLSGLQIRRKNGMLSILSTRNILKAQAEKIVFVFPGGGSYYENALSSLRRENAHVDKHLQHILSMLVNSEEHSYLEEFFSNKMNEKSFDDLADNPTLNLLVTFIINHVCGAALLENGIRPQFMMGHSLGEYNALVLSGRLDLSVALKIVKKRGEIFSRVKGFRLLNLSCSSSVLEMMSPKPQIIAYNGEENLTVVIPEPELETFVELLCRRSIQYSHVSINVPAHSAFLDPHLEEFRQFLKSFNLRPGTIPLISNVSGTLLEEGLENLGYLADHLRMPVKFSQGIQCSIALGVNTFVQVGAGYGLVSSIKGGEDLNSLSSVGSESDNEIANFLILNRLLKFTASDSPKGPTPAYPFLLKKCWPKKERVTIQSHPQATPYIEVILPLKTLFQAKSLKSSTKRNDSSFEVLEWDSNPDDVNEIFQLILKLRKIDETLSSPKLVYLVRQKNEKPGELLVLRSLITSFNIESHFLAVKILSFNEGIKNFDFSSFHSKGPNLECSYFDDRFEWVPAYALYAPQTESIVENGEIIIVGGLGRVGLRLCEKLLLQSKKKLIVCGRSDLSSSALLSRLSSSPALVSAFQLGKVQYQAIKNGKELAQLANQMNIPESLVFCASGSQNDSIRRSVEEIQQMDFFEQMESKLTLYSDFLKSFKSEKPLKVIFISSNASRLSGPGMMAYAYASAQVDKLCLRDHHVSSISFDAFRFPGDDLPEVTNHTDADGLYRAYDLALKAELGLNIILSNQFFSERIEEWVRRKNTVVSEKSSVDISNVPVLDVITEVFGTMLGLESYTKDMDFFLSGGHSLLAFRVLGRLNSLYGVRLTMKQLKLNPTPMKLNDTIEELLKKKQTIETKTEESLDIDKLLAEIEK